MALLIDNNIWELFPGLRLVVVVGRDVDNRKRPPELETDLAVAEEDLWQSWAYPNPQSHPHIAAWRQAFKQMGLSVKKYSSAIESLTRRVLQGKRLARINPLVDFYNLLSVNHVVPAGGLDLDQLNDDVRLGVTAGGERFQELGRSRDAAVRTKPGEVAYLDGAEVITRHFVWRQSEKGKITPATESVFLMSELLPEVDDDAAKQVQAAFVDGLRAYFRVETEAVILQAGTGRWDW